MIADRETNFLYLAGSLPVKYPDFFARLENSLNDIGLNWALLPKTKDVWAVDYMPVQVNINTFVDFIYQPSYLTRYKKYANTITDADAVCSEVGINTVKADIILDGGNVTRCKNSVIVTDRIFKDNPCYERKKLIKTLYEFLEVEKLYLIPEQPGDFTGHSDGMIRFVDENTVVINDYARENQRFQSAFDIAIHNTGLDYVKLAYNPYDNKSNDQANGDYINFLQMENTLVVPTFGIREDDIAIRCLETIYPQQKIVTIESNEVANDGGVLNCISWNIKISPDSSTP
jgi:agmatine deiminase